MLKIILFAALKGLLVVAIEVLATVVLILVIHYICKLILGLRRTTKQRDLGTATFQGTKLTICNTVGASPSRRTVIEGQPNESLLITSDKQWPPKEGADSVADLVLAGTNAI